MPSYSITKLSLNFSLRNSISFIMSASFDSTFLTSKPMLNPKYLKARLIVKMFWLFAIRLKIYSFSVFATSVSFSISTLSISPQETKRAASPLSRRRVKSFPQTCFGEIFSFFALKFSFFLSRLRP